MSVTFSRDVTQLPMQGGYASPSRVISWTCDDDELLTGFTIRNTAPDPVDVVQSVWSPVCTNWQTGESRTLGESATYVGTNTTGPVQTVQCPAGSYISAIDANWRDGYNTRITSGVGIRCSDIKSGAQTYSHDVITSEALYPQTCPSGYYVNQINLTGGDVLNTIQGQCINMNARRQVLLGTEYTAECCMGIGDPLVCGEYTPHSGVCDSFFNSWCQTHPNDVRCTCYQVPAGIPPCYATKCLNTGYLTSNMKSTCPTEYISCNAQLAAANSGTQLVGTYELQQNCGQGGSATSGAGATGTQTTGSGGGAPVTTSNTGGAGTATIPTSSGSATLIGTPVSVPVSSSGIMGTLTGPASPSAGSVGTSGTATIPTSSGSATIFGIPVSIPVKSGSSGTSGTSASGAGTAPTVTIPTASGPVTITGTPVSVPTSDGTTITASGGLLGSGAVTTSAPSGGAGATGSSTGVLTVSNVDPNAPAGTAAPTVGAVVTTPGASGATLGSLSTTASTPTLSATTSSGTGGDTNSTGVVNPDGTVTTTSVTVTPSGTSAPPVVSTGVQTGAAQTPTGVVASAGAPTSAAGSQQLFYLFLLLLLAVFVGAVYMHTAGAAGATSAVAVAATRA